MSHSHRSDDPLQSVEDVVGDSTLGIALTGALVGLLIGYVPGSPLIGGAIAGYLVRRDRGRGTRVGALSGLFVALPSAVGLLFGLGITAGFAFFAAPLAVLAAFVLAFGLLGVLYTVGLAAIGGYIGVVASERRRENVTRRDGSGRHRDVARRDDTPHEDARRDDTPHEDARYEDARPEHRT